MPRPRDTPLTSEPLQFLGRIFPSRPPGFYRGVAFKERFDAASVDDQAMALKKAEEALHTLVEAAKIIDPNADLPEGGAMFACFSIWAAKAK